LTREEFAGFLDRQPDLELQLALGRVTADDRRRSRGRMRVEPEWRARRKLDGGYELSLGDLEIDLKRNNRNPQQADIYNFRTFDTDNNEYVDERESLANGIGRAAWEAMDVDGDKKVYRGEFTSFLDRQTEAASVRIQLEVSDLGQDLFAILDLDMDGRLSSRELRTAKNILAVADENGDGALNGDEIPLRLILELVRGADAPSEEEARVARGRIARSTARANTAGPLWFRKMDRNNDGDLSPEEFSGPVDAFQKLDADGDGLVDRDEAEAVAE
jgi:Ca2+-binding EF-hand superfamily protein